MATKYDIVSKFLGYRTKTDITNLPPGTLVEGSENVLINDGDRVSVRQGFTLDGQANSATTPIKSAYDWIRSVGDERHLRSYYDQLEYRYVDSDGTITWNQLKNGWGSSVAFNYTEFWNTTEQIDELLFVNGDGNIYEWSGGVTTVASTGVDTITKEGTKTWAEEGFLTDGVRGVVIDGVTYTYTGGEDTTTLTGVDPTPSVNTIDQSQTTSNGTLGFGEDDATVTDQSQTTENTPIPFGEEDLTNKNTRIAQSFIPASSSLVGVELYKTADTGTYTGDVVVEILRDAGGYPNISLRKARFVFSNAEWLAIPVGAFQVLFNTPASLTIGDTYWITLEPTTYDTLNHPNIGTNNSGGYTDGEIQTFNSTDGWTVPSGADFYFKTFSSVGLNLVAQSFIPTDADIVGVVFNKQTDTGTFTGDVTIDLMADVAGSPSGISLATKQYLNADWVLLPNGNLTAEFASPFVVTPGDTYWIVFTSSTNDNDNHANIGVNKQGGYADGLVQYFNSVSSWSVYPVIDFYFQTVVSLDSVPAGTIVVQAVRTNLASDINDVPTEFHADLISTLYNQVYLGNTSNRQVYVSKVDDFLDYAFASPRLVGEGALFTLDGTTVGFVPQEDSMYITAGNDFWYQTQFILGSDQSQEALEIIRFKTTVQSAAQSQALISKIKNYVFYIDNEPSLSTLGKIELINTPQTSNISDPIKPTFDNYDFTDGSCFYWQNYMFITVPAENRVLMFNVSRALKATDSESVVSLNAVSALVGWEAPQVLPISRFAIIDGDLYGHSSQVPETYKMFDGWNDNGAPIFANVSFAYQQNGDRANNKTFNEIYCEGYITPNTTVNVEILNNYQGTGGSITKQILGTDPIAVPSSTVDGSLGKQSLGTHSLAGRGLTDSTDSFQKFRVIKTFPQNQVYEYQVSVYSEGIDQRWSLLAIGPNVMNTTTTNQSISE